MVEGVASALGPLDVLVNNAGIFPRSPFLDLREDEWTRVLDVNLKGSFLCAQAAARAMVAGARPGAIVNLASVGHAGHAARRALRRQQGGRGRAHPGDGPGARRPRRRVNAIAPGLTDTAQPRYGNTEAELQALARDIPLEGRMARPEEIASVAVFLASEEARWITGQVIHVNGGTFMA